MTGWEDGAMDFYHKKNNGITFSNHCRKPLVRRKPENPAKSSPWSRSATIWTIGAQTDDLHAALTLNLGVSRSFLVFKYVYPLLESQHVLPQLGYLILTTNGAHLSSGSRFGPEIGSLVMVMCLTRSRAAGQNTFELDGISCPCENAALNLPPPLASLHTSGSL